MERLFISYSRKDSAIARQLADSLNKAGYDVWWDISDLQGGDDWLRTIPAAIESSQYFVLLLSPGSTTSEWVEREYLHAINRHLKIIPVMLQQCQIPFALANINYIDFTGRDYATNLQNLLNALRTGANPQDEPANPPQPPTPLTKKTALWIGLAALLGILILSGILKTTGGNPTLTPKPVTFTVTDSHPSLTPTTSPTSESSATPTRTETATLTATSTGTSTATPTSTPTATTETFPRVELCVQPEITALLVRAGPGRTYEALTIGLAGGDCLIFSARNETSTWYMIGIRQPNPKFTDFEYGWVAGGFLDLSGEIPLPVATPIPTATRTPHPTITPTFTPTVTFTPTITFTPTPSNTPIPTDTRVPTATLEITDSPTP